MVFARNQGNASLGFISPNEEKKKEGEQKSVYFRIRPSIYWRAFSSTFGIREYQTKGPWKEKKIMHTVSSPCLRQAVYDLQSSAFTCCG